MFSPLRFVPGSGCPFFRVQAAAPRRHARIQVCERFLTQGYNGREEAKATKTFALLVLYLLISMQAFGASQPQLQVLYNFNAGADGFNPQGSLVADEAGNLYGVTALGGGASRSCYRGKGCGTVFELVAPAVKTKPWIYKTLYRFTGGFDGGQPIAGLIIDAKRNLYGTTSSGGAGLGLVFELSPVQGGGWQETVLHTFEYADGAVPSARLLFDATGNLYGTTQLGGSNSYGTAFELTPSEGGGWTETVLYNFGADLDGSMPVAGLTFDQQGNLYGTTENGGINGDFGTVFELTPTAQGWTETILISFTGVYSSAPRAEVIFDAAGNIYGTSSTGGPVGGNCPTGCGSVFQLTPSENGAWDETVLYNFDLGNNAFPLTPVIADVAGNLYGTSSAMNCGSIYRLRKQSNWKQDAMNLLYNTTSKPCGPNAPLFGKFGALYASSGSGGSSLSCGANVGCGTVFGIFP